jgi:hypothetical protein
LSRYTALYTSLSTTYELEFPNVTTVAAPFPTRQDFQMLPGQGLQAVDFQRYDDVRLTGLPISSNSTGMVHSEQMVTLDGGIQLGTSQATSGQQIENRSKLKLQSACILKRDGAALRGMWIGEFLPGKSVRVALKTLERGEPAFATDRTTEGRTQSAERLNLEPMFRLALDPQMLEDGETRFVARVDEVMPGQAITPSASQVRGATLVVAHLGYAPLPQPRKDQNTRQDLKGIEDAQMDLEF